MEFLEGKYLIVTRNSPFERLDLTDYALDWFDSLEEVEAHLDKDESILDVPPRYEELYVIKIERVKITIQESPTDIPTFEQDTARRRIENLEKVDWRELTENEQKYLGALVDFIEGKRDFPTRTLGIG